MKKEVLFEVPFEAKDKGGANVIDFRMQTNPYFSPTLSLSPAL